MMPHSRLLVFLIALFAAGPSFSIERGADAPAFELEGTLGKVRLDAYRGKLVYLDFWASWCGPCRQSFPWMSAMEEKYRARGFHVLAVNLDVKRVDADRFLAQLPTDFQLAFDPKGLTPRDYAVKGMPTSFLIGRDGKVLYRHTGFNPASQAELEQVIKNHLDKDAN